MNKQKVLVLLLQETHVNQNVREIRKNYTWFFAGDTEKNGGKNHTEAGVATIIHNSLVNYIWDIQSYSDRLISITLGYAIPVSFISAYMYTAAALSEDKNNCYKKIKEIQTQLQKQGQHTREATSTQEYK